MNPTAENEVIVFDNLVGPTAVDGKYAPVTMPVPSSEPFSNVNAAGDTKTVVSLDEIKEMASESGGRLKEALRS